MVIIIIVSVIIVLMFDHITHRRINREMNTKLNHCNTKLSGATRFVCQMNKFVDRARRFKFQKSIQGIEFDIRTYDSLHIDTRTTGEDY